MYQGSLVEGHHIAVIYCYEVRVVQVNGGEQAIELNSAHLHARPRDYIEHICR